MEYSGFFNGSGHSYGEADFARYFENIYENGVSVDGKDLMTMQVSTANNKLTVNPGFAMIKGYYLYLSDVKTLAVEKPASGVRYDRVVVALDSNGTTSAMTVVVRKGTATNANNLIRTGNIYELALAIIKVDSTGKINLVADERASTTACGAIRPKNISAYNTMIKSFEAKFENWLTTNQDKARNVYVQQEQPNERVRGSIWIETSAI